MKIFLVFLLFNQLLFDDNNNDMEITGKESEIMRLYKIKNQGFLPQQNLKIANSYIDLLNNTQIKNNKTQNIIFLKKQKTQKTINPN
jgi:hypothetical protein